MASVEIVISYTAEILTIISSLILFVFLTATLLPTLLMTPKFSDISVRDRGIKKYRFPNGRAVSYQPDCNIEKYIPKYTLLCIDGKKYLKCKLDTRVCSFAIKVIVFDSKKAPIKLIDVVQSVALAGESKSVVLPSETSFVSLRLSAVNGVALPEEDFAFYPLQKLGVLFASVTACTVAEAFLLKSIFFRFAKDVLPRYASGIDGGFGFTFITALIVGALLSFAVIFIHRTDGVSLFSVPRKRK